MLVRLSAVAVALLLLASGCGGGDGPSRRELVAGYIEKVNAIQAKLAAPSSAIGRASRRIAKPRSDRAAVSLQLRDAARQIDRLRAKAAALRAPADARRLRSLELELMERQAELARELAALATFGPAYQAALTPLGPSGVRLEAALTAKNTPAAKAAALDLYAVSTSAALRRLEVLDPPRVSTPAYRTQIYALQGVHAAALALGRALREKNAGAIPALLRRFELAARSNQTLGAQKMQIAAVRAYNKRVRSLDDIAIRIHRERARLQQILA
jgi:hypothetical protein